MLHDLAVVREGLQPMIRNPRDSNDTHRTIVFCARTIARELHATTGVSIQKLVRSLEPLHDVGAKIAGQEVVAATPLRIDTTKILENL